MTCTEAPSGRPKLSAKPDSWALADLPPFPAVAVQLMRLFSKPDADIVEIGRIVAHDQVFASRVLQMANSPLFAVRSEVRSISHAIILLGMNRVRAITMTRALGDFVWPALKFRALQVCWKNSLAGAILSEKLANACKMDPDFAYVAGLMRDIGRLGLLVKYPEPYANLLAVSEENCYDLLATEYELFDVDHCQAGAWITEDLHFLAELREVIAWHHETLDPKSFRMVHLVHIADLMADALGFSVVSPIHPQTYEEVLGLLPEAARARFVEDPEILAADIDSRIRTWQ
jgi:HD-like signal output (HDOD) protein